MTADTGLRETAHVFRHMDPQAPCPVCGFPAWAHDPAAAVLYNREVLPATTAPLDPNLLRKAMVRHAEVAGLLDCPAKCDFHCADDIAAHYARLTPDGTAPEEETP